MSTAHSELIQTLYGCLPHSEPIVTYVNTVYNRYKHPDANITIEILPAWNEIQAIACGNTVLLAKGLMDFLEFEEELVYVLKHEESHIVEGHAEKLVKNVMNPAMSWKDLMKERTMEYAADLLAYINTADIEGNPFGGYSLLRKFDSMEDLSDIAHGPSAYRRIMQRLMVRVLDTPTLNRNMMPMPRLAIPPRNSLDCLCYAPKDRIKVANACDLHACLVNLESVWPEAAEQQKYLQQIARPDRSEVYAKLLYAKPLLNTLATRLRKELEDRDVPESYFGLLLTACAGIDYMDELRNTKLILQSCPFEEHQCEPFIDWNRETLRQLGVVGRYPEKLETLTTHCMTDRLARLKHFDWQKYLADCRTLATNLATLFPIDDCNGVFFQGFVDTGRLSLTSNEEQEVYDELSRDGQANGGTRTNPKIEKIVEFAKEIWYKNYDENII